MDPDAVEDLVKFASITHNLIESALAAGLTLPDTIIRMMEEGIRQEGPDATVYCWVMIDFLRSWQALVAE